MGTERNAPLYPGLERNCPFLRCLISTTDGREFALP
jgi:hypothetical protein